MLLRRVTQHIKKQDWFAVFLDFLIVVIGIFIGLQVTEWHKSIESQKLTEQYQVRILNDFKGSIEMNNVFIKRLDNKVTMINEVVDLIESNIEFNPEQHGEMLYSGLSRTYYAWTFSANVTTLEEMISSGTFSYLEDKKLKQLLLSLKGVIQEHESYIAQMINRVNSLSSQLDSSVAAIRFKLGGKSVFDNQKVYFDYDFNELKEDRKIRVALKNLAGLALTNQAFIKSVQTKLEEIVEIIERKALSSKQDQNL